MANYSLRGNLTRALSISAGVVITLSLFVSLYIGYRKISDDNNRYHQLIHTTLTSLILPSLEISDFSEVQRLLSLSNRHDFIVGVLTEHGDALMADYQYQPLFDEWKGVVSQESCHGVMGSTTAFGGTPFVGFCTDLLLERPHPSRPNHIGYLISFRPRRLDFLGGEPILWLSLVGVLAILASIFFSRWLLVKNVLKPLESLATAVLRRASQPIEEQADPVLTEDAPLEISSIKTTIDALFDTLREQKRRSDSLGKKEALYQIAAQVAHDIRSPLGAFKIATDALTAKLGSSPELDLLEASQNRVRGIADDLLARTKAHGLAATSLEIMEVLESIRREKLAVFSNVLRINIGERPPGFTSKANTDRLARIFSNIINNSVEAASGSPVKVEVTFELTDSSVEIAFSDDGPGFSAEAIQMIGKASYTDKQTGYGLGLISARQALASWGGSLKVTAASPGARISVVLQTTK